MSPPPDALSYQSFAAVSASLGLETKLRYALAHYPRSFFDSPAIWRTLPTALGMRAIKYMKGIACGVVSFFLPAARQQAWFLTY